MSQYVPQDIKDTLLHLQFCEQAVVYYNLYINELGLSLHVHELCISVVLHCLPCAKN